MITIIKKLLRKCLLFFGTLLLPLLRMGKKKTILLMDRPYAAGDNAEALYHYLKTNKDYHVYFCLNKSSRDWNRMQPDRHMIDLKSLRYLILFLRADAVLFSYNIWYPRGGSAFKNQLMKVFLQHGIMQNDLSSRYNAATEDYVIVGTEDEYNDRLQPKYGFKPEQVILTGIPRYDYLKKRSKKIITIGLTWRLYLKGKDTEEFAQSSYYEMIADLIVHPELSDLAEKYGCQIQFVPHPETTQEQIEYLKEVKDVRVIVNTNRIYKDILSESVLLITDYSSLAFDCAYLKTPVLYYQADEQEFYSGKHTYTRGYFDYRKNGFGEVTAQKDVLLKTLEEYLASDCVMKDSYQKRVEKTFRSFESNHCERAWRDIEDRLGWKKTKA